MTQKQNETLWEQWKALPTEVQDKVARDVFCWIFGASQSSKHGTLSSLFFQRLDDAIQELEPKFPRYHVKPPMFNGWIICDRQRADQPLRHESNGALITWEDSESAQETCDKLNNGILSM